MCGPAVSYLLAQHDYKPKNTPDTDYLLTFLEQILPACSYAIPALYYVALHQQGTDVGRFAHRLLCSFDPEALKPYECLLAFLPSDV
jgi:hypothetical protein